MLERNKTDEEFSHKKALFGLQLFQLLIVSKETCRNWNTKIGTCCLRNINFREGLSIYTNWSIIEILPLFHRNPCLEDLEEVLLFRKNFSSTSPCWPHPLKASEFVHPSWPLIKVVEKSCTLSFFETSKKSCTKISFFVLAWTSQLACLRTDCTFFEKMFWQPSGM